MGDPRRHPAYSRGEGLTPENLERVDRLASRLERVSVEGMDADFDDAGLSLRNSTQPGFWARITAKTPTSQALYSWEEVTRVGGSSAAYVALDGGLSGTYDGGGAGPAREVRDRPDVPADPATGQVAWLTLSDDGESFDFAFGGIAAPAPLTAREVDGSPSVSPVTVIEFDHATGLKVTDQTGGVARLELEGAFGSQWGAVTDGPQVFLGLKGFDDGLTAQYGEIPWQLSGTTLKGVVPYLGYGVVSRGPPVDVNVGALYFGAGNDWPNGEAVLGVAPQDPFSPGTTLGGTTLHLRRGNVGVGGGHLLLYHDGAAGNYPYFAVHDGTTQRDGVSVTEAGVTYAGGIRTGGTLAISLTGAVTGSLSGGSIATTYAGTIDGGAWT